MGKYLKLPNNLLVALNTSFVREGLDHARAKWARALAREGAAAASNLHSRFRDSFPQTAMTRAVARQKHDRVGCC